MPCWNLCILSDIEGNEKYSIIFLIKAHCPICKIVVRDVSVVNPNVIYVKVQNI